MKITKMDTKITAFCLFLLFAVFGIGTLVIETSDENMNGVPLKYSLEGVPEILGTKSYSKKALDAALYNEPILGINFGTTSSRVALYYLDSFRLMKDDHGNKLNPSLVSFNGSSVYIEEAARNQSTHDPKHAITDFTQLIGTKFDDREVQTEIKSLPSKVVNKDGKPFIEVTISDDEIKLFSSEEITALILKKIKDIADSLYELTVKNVDITLPAYHSDSKRLAIQKACTLAGVNIMGFVSEPIAAAVSYDFDEKGKQMNILVFDLGDTRLNVSIVNVAKGGDYEVLSSASYTHLEGETFDRRVITYLTKLVKKKYINKDKDAVAKRSQESRKFHLEIASLVDDFNISGTLTKAIFEKLNVVLLQRMLEPVKKALAKSNLTKLDIDEILLAGEGSQISKVHQLLKDFFDGNEPLRLMNPHETKAFGAGVQSGILRPKREISLRDQLTIEVFPDSFGIETNGGIMSEIIPESTIIAPNRKSNTGVPRIEISMVIDDDGKFHVTAEDKAIRIVQSITIS